MCEILWNDPSDDDLKGFRDSERGVGKVFGEEPFQQFLHNNSLT
jgi:hypothetical protein